MRVFQRFHAKELQAKLVRISDLKFFIFLNELLQAVRHLLRPDLALVKASS